MTWQDRNPPPVLPAEAFDKMHAERRVEDARENLLDQAIQLSLYLTQLAGNRRVIAVAGNVTIQAFNLAVNDYQLALENH